MHDSPTKISPRQQIISPMPSPRHLVRSERLESVPTNTHLTLSRPRVGMDDLLQFPKPTCQLLVVYLEWVVRRWQVKHLVVFNVRRHS